MTAPFPFHDVADGALFGDHDRDTSPYRYLLWRTLDPGGLGTMVILGVNPSTAGRHTNDATVRRGLGFAERGGYARLVFANPFAYRTPDVRLLSTVADPIGPDNLTICQRLRPLAPLVVCAWGQTAKLPRELRSHPAAFARQIGVSLFCFRTLANGDPEHPLFLPYTCTPRPYDAPSPSRSP